MAAPRSIGSLTVSFGLVAIPVKLYSATQSANTISFNLLHRTCGSRLKQQYLCQKEGVVVDRDDMAKGYEFAKDQYVMFSPQEIKALEEVGTHSVDITEFVPVESIDPVYFDKTYYLAPDKGAAKPYALLTEALKQSGRCGVGHWAARGKAYLVVMRPIGTVLSMQQLHFAADVRGANEIEVPKTEVRPAELKLAEQLIGQQTAERFDPQAYKDDLHARLQSAIDRKVAEGKEIAVSEAAPAGDGKVIDLMEALRASLEKSATARAQVSRLGPRKEPRRAEAPAHAEDAAPARTPARKAGKRSS
ncbi:MAG: Ku protein [Proteobacteria bacterium]|nr:Ku protein [Pseudomonadota bacterium]